MRQRALAQIPRSFTCFTYTCSGHARRTARLNTTRPANINAEPSSAKKGMYCQPSLQHAVYQRACAELCLSQRQAPSVSNSAVQCSRLIWLLLQVCTHDWPHTTPGPGLRAAHQSALRLLRRLRLVRGCTLGGACGSASASAVHGDSTRGFTGVDGASSSLYHAGEAGASRSAHDARQSMFIAATAPAQPKHKSSCGLAALAGLCSTSPRRLVELQLSSPSWRANSARCTRVHCGQDNQCPRCALQTPKASLVYLQQQP